MATADGGRVLMVVSTVLAVFVVLALLGVLDWSLPLAGSHRQAGTPTSAGGRVFSGGGPKGGVGSWVSQRDVADLATELAASGWPSLALTVEGNSLQVSGTVANEQERADVITIAELRLASAPIVDRLTISTGDPAHVMVEVSQRGLTLTGTVPNEAMAEELATRAGVVYLDRQISNRLRVDGTVGAPMAITATGELTSERLLESVVGQFSGIVGVEPVLTDQLLLVEPTPIEDALNGFGEIRFASGSAVILSEAGPILDQIAVIMGSNPHTAVEIGGHTTDDDDSEALRALSQARADVVRSELVARGVSNELLANGYGGRRPGADGLDGTAAGSSPRSGSIVEFRVLD